MSLATIVDKPIWVDLNTVNVECGKYARVCE